MTARSPLFFISFFHIFPFLLQVIKLRIKTILMTPIRNISLPGNQVAL